MMVIKYIDMLIQELEMEKTHWKDWNSKYNVTNCKNQLFQLNAIKRMLQGDGKNMKSELLERLDKIDSELHYYINLGNVYKVQSLRQEKKQIENLLNSGLYD